MLDVASPPARRLALPRWLNLRLGVGVVLVLVSTVVGARLVGSADRTQPVWVARHALPVGYQVSRDDFAVADVRLGRAAPDYLSAAAPAPHGYLVQRPVAAGELVPAGALGAPGRVDEHRQTVAVPVDGGHYPRDLGVGDLVDVYVTSKSSDGAAGSLVTTRVLSAVPVERVPGGGGGVFAGPASTGAAVELSVASADTAALVGALETGHVDLVRTPATDHAAVTP